MAKITSFSPTTTITRAMFDFDVMGLDEFRLRGPIRVSLSDSFVAADVATIGFYPDLYNADGARVNWNAEAFPNGTTLASNVEQTLGILAQFAHLDFKWLGEITSIGTDIVVNPGDVGAAHLSDINISLVRRNLVGWVGISGVGSDDIFEYEGAAGDVYINKAFLTDSGFGLGSPSRTVLMHELLHSLGMSHPHSEIINGVLIITGEYAQTEKLGFDKLGFDIDNPRDMYREYFSIMSYDDENPFEEAHTPMILDVIALQQAYGEGPGTQTNGTGTSTTGNDTITAGTEGYRVYFDKSGNDTIDLSQFQTGAYLHMGTTITGAAHLVGVAMSAQDFAAMSAGGDPLNLRWFYGEFENATGSAAADRIVGNSRANHIFGMDGADKLYGENSNDVLNGGTGSDLLAGGKGNDQLLGGPGTDTADYSTAISKVVVNLAQTGAQNTEGAGIDTLSSMENLIGSSFNDRLIGDAKANSLSGNDGNDRLRGAAGDDILNGGSGIDSLSGGSGKDTFVFGKSAFSGVDQILDFNGADDSLRLDNALFTRLSHNGALSASNYHESSNGLAQDAHDLINYNTRTGALSYDADGSGTGAPVQFATLFDGHGGHPLASQLSPLDFVIV